MIITSVLVAPLLLVVGVFAAYRYGFRRRPFTTRASVISVALASVAFLSPLLIGVWLPDVLGREVTIQTMNLNDGETISVVQYWNYSDFYSTEARVTDATGRTAVYTLDGDDHRHWIIPIQFDYGTRTATFHFSDGRRPTVHL